MNRRWPPSSLFRFITACAVVQLPAKKSITKSPSPPFLCRLCGQPQQMLHQPHRLRIFKETFSYQFCDVFIGLVSASHFFEMQMTACGFSLFDFGQKEFLRWLRFPCFAEPESIVVIQFQHFVGGMQRRPSFWAFPSDSVWEGESVSFCGCSTDCVQRNDFIRTALIVVGIYEAGVHFLGSWKQSRREFVNVFGVGNHHFVLARNLFGVVGWRVF